MRAAFSTLGYRPPVFSSLSHPGRARSDATLRAEASRTGVGTGKKNGGIDVFEDFSRNVTLNGCCRRDFHWKISSSSYLDIYTISYE